MKPNAIRHRRATPACQLQLQVERGRRLRDKGRRVDNRRGRLYGTDRQGESHRSGPGGTAPRRPRSFKKQRRPPPRQCSANISRGIPSEADRSRQAARAARLAAYGANPQRRRREWLRAGDGQRRARHVQTPQAIDPRLARRSHGPTGRLRRVEVPIPAAPVGCCPWVGRTRTRRRALR
jgi:hypothetical protein